jgi:phage terminase large subunit-like protein
MVAAMLGKPLMEWQQHVVDVLLELDPDTGELVYTDWTLLVPRQSGKSILILAKASHRCLATKFFGGNQQIAYAAQTKLKAVDKFERDYARAIKYGASKIKARARTGNSKVDIRYPNGSLFAVEAVTEKAGHGDILDEAYIDEAFSQPDNRMEQAFEPAMITRANHQLGSVSTAGWEDASPYLLGKVQAGRKLVEQDVRHGTAFFEWSAPEDADPGAAETWLACMPALHRPDCPPGCRQHTVAIKTVRGLYEKAVRENKLADFRRAYLNQWQRKPREGEETALGNWAGCGQAVEAFPDPLAIGVSISRDREFASIGTCGMVDDIPLVSLNQRREGTDWLAGEAARISKAYRIPVIVDTGSNTGKKLAQAIRDDGGTVVEASLDDYVAACSDIFDRVRDKRIIHPNNQTLTEHVESARWRPVGDARRVFGHRVSAGDIDGIVAAALALWGAITKTAQPTGFALTIGGTE